MADTKEHSVERLIGEAERFLTKAGWCNLRDVSDAAPILAVLSLTGERRKQAALAMFLRLGEIAEQIESTYPDVRLPHGWYAGSHVLLTSGGAWGKLLAKLMSKDCDFSDVQWRQILGAISKFHHVILDQHAYLTLVTSKLAAMTQQPPVAPEMAASLTKIADALCTCGIVSQYRLADKIRGLCHSKPMLPLSPGEAWSDVAISDILARPTELQRRWGELLEHCEAASGGAPNAKWLNAGKLLLKSIKTKSFREHLLRWFPLVDAPRTIAIPRETEYDLDATYILCDAHTKILRGLCWLAATMQDPDLVRALGRLALSSYKKVPGLGPRAVKVGHAAIYALGAMPGRDSLGQLAMLKVKVKFIPAQKGIDKALTAAAVREGLPRDEIEELAVPTYGLGDVGLLEEPMGDVTARLTVSGVGDTELVFVKADGKVIKSAPAAVKTSHAEELKDLKAAIKDITAMLPAQKDRIDTLFLEQRSWTMATWRERYLDHPLVGVLARRLIWCIASGADGPWKPVTWLDGKLVDSEALPRSFDEATAIVRLWHPLDSTTADVLTWRKFFENRAIQQPFKQAHREVYRLTDAERNTATYSNRYAAHVIRQHQFHALCAARNWRNKLRLMVDAEYPPASRTLAAWGLRAEYWIEGAGDEFGTDTNDAGAYNFLITDQVRFYRTGAAQATAHACGGGYSVQQAQDRQAPATTDEPNAPLSLETIPPLVLSEIMRDVDLFVGVSSVGNNPTWQDGGPGNTYREYWWSYGFGDLSGTAEGRRDLLGRLLPRLKIAPVCTLSDRFLIVRGKLRTYKIHLGSGNILMEPNDEYLCIVPGSQDQRTENVHLPFDGDRTLSIILSKAFMLAEDDKSKDVTITRQISP